MRYLITHPQYGKVSGTLVSARHLAWLIQAFRDKAYTIYLSQGHFRADSILVAIRRS